MLLIVVMVVNYMSLHLDLLRTPSIILTGQTLRRQLGHIRALRFTLQQHLAHHLSRPRRIADTPTRMPTGDIYVLLPWYSANKRSAPAGEGEETRLFGANGGI